MHLHTRFFETIFACSMPCLFALKISQCCMRSKACLQVCLLSGLADIWSFLVVDNVSLPSLTLPLLCPLLIIAPSFFISFFVAFSLASFVCFYCLFPLFLLQWASFIACVVDNVSPVYGFCVSSFVSFLRFLVCFFSCFISQENSNSD